MKKSKGQLVITMTVPVNTAEAAVMFANFAWQWFTYTSPDTMLGNIDAEFQPDVTFKPAKDLTEWTTKNIVAKKRKKKVELFTVVPKAS